MTEQKENQTENPTAKKDHSTGWIVLIYCNISLVAFLCRNNCSVFNQ